MAKKEKTKAELEAERQSVVAQCEEMEELLRKAEHGMRQLEGDRDNALNALRLVRDEVRKTILMAQACVATVTRMKYATTAQDSFGNDIGSIATDDYTEEMRALEYLLGVVQCTNTYPNHEKGK